MAKNLRWTAKQMQDKGLVSDAKGDYVPVSSLVQRGKVQKFETMIVDGVEHLVSHTKEQFFDNLFLMGSTAHKIETDLFGVPLPIPIPNAAFVQPDTSLDPLSGEYILWVRTLTGKARDSAVMALNDLTVNMMQEADKDCFYIPNDVRSSKNSKEIGRFKKRNAAGLLEDFTTLVESKAAKEYRKVTANYWLQNKVEFLNQSRGLKLPLRIEFTFIRETLRRWDFVNGAQILLDLMVEFGYMPDDETCYIVPVFNPVYYSKQLAGVMLKIIK